MVLAAVRARSPVAWPAPMKNVADAEHAALAPVRRIERAGHGPGRPGNAVATTPGPAMNAPKAQPTGTGLISTAGPAK
ncbi:hypothetical protein ACFCXS_05545 [Streptomyces sp. NPDC056373]|uniref:hypothetical protein n=1 Tax=Streptomyces sp. NPDC056373 TaxID=3345798 RepID=UPI0035D9A87D